MDLFTCKNGIFKKYVIKLAFTIFVFFTLSYSSNSDSVILYDIDASFYPAIKAKFIVKDGFGQQITNISEPDITLTENKVVRDVKIVKCPEPSTKPQLSIALSIDISISMLASDFYETPIAMSKTTAINFIHNLQSPQPEIALQSCDSNAKIVENFTKDKLVLENSVSNLAIGNGNDFNEHLFNPDAGLLYLANQGKYNKIAVMLTDAWADRLPDEDLQKYINYCNDNKITFYAVIYSRPELKPDGIRNSFRTLAESTGGRLYDGITNTNAALDLANRLQEDLQGSGSCEIEWESGIGCKTGPIEVEMSVKSVSAKGYANYKSSYQIIPKLEFNPSNIFFENCTKGKSRDTLIEISAYNTPINVTKITCTNPSFTINSTGFFINPGQNQFITVTFKPMSAGFQYAVFDFENDYCPFSLTVGGEVKGSADSLGRLELMHPNGGELFLVGDDTQIIWAGIPEKDTCLIEYSTNFGKNWQFLSDKATGFKFDWINIPKPASNQCFVRIKQLLNGTPKQLDLSDSVFRIAEPILRASDIYFGKWVIGGTKDSTISDYFVNNEPYNCRIDSIYFRGNDALTFAVISELLPLSVKSNNKLKLRIGFTPDRLGPHRAEIVIVTQSDTLIYNIVGEGVEPVISILNDTIDFGSIRIGTYKDTLKAATIKNIGKVPLKIYKTIHLNPNSMFETLTGGGTLTLQPGDTAKIDLRFTPAIEEQTNGQLLVYSDGVGSPSTVNLTGAGVINAYKIQYQLQDFPELVCDSLYHNNLTIFNAGKFPLNFKNLTVKGENADDFSISDFNPFNLKPDSSKQLTVRFKPKEKGLKTAFLELKSDAEPDSVLSVILIARKEEVKFNSDVSLIDLGTLCPGETKDTLVRISNTGTISTSVNSVTSKNLIAEVNNFKLDKDEYFNFNFSFTGITQQGIFLDTLTFTDSICGFSSEVLITGIIEEPEIIAEGLTFTSLIGSSYDGKVTLTNNSVRDITITNIAQISPPFALVGSPFPLTLSKGGKAELNFRYSPDNNNEVVNLITIEAMPCNINKIIQLNGLPFNSELVLEIPQVEAYSGDEIEVPIYLKETENLQLSGITHLDCQLNFNPTLLFPLDYTAQSVDNKNAKITLENLSLNKTDGEPITKIRFKAALGNAESCPLSLLNVKTIGVKAHLSTVNGQFKLLGICYDGGARLINPNGESSISIVKPNPAGGEAEFEIETIESGLTQIFISNLLGEKVLVLHDGKMSKGKYNYKISTTDLNSGIYFIMMQTPTMILQRRMIILK